MQLLVISYTFIIWITRPLIKCINNYIYTLIFIFVQVYGFILTTECYFCSTNKFEFLGQNQTSFIDLLPAWIKLLAIQIWTVTTKNVVIS